MSDNELREIMLKFFYERRRDSRRMLRISDFPPAIAELGSREINRICRQLKECGCLEYGVYSNGGAYGQAETSWQVRITGPGADVVEGKSPSNSAITIDQRQTVSVSDSSNVQVGNGNSISTLIQVDALNKAIDQSNFSPVEKKEAKSALSKLLEHPVIVAIIGGLASNVGKAD